MMHAKGRAVVSAGGRCSARCRGREVHARCGAMAAVLGCTWGILGVGLRACEVLLTPVPRARKAYAGYRSTFILRR